MKNYIKFNLTDLPIHKFVILLKPKIQEKLIIDSVNKIAKKTRSWGKYKRLAIYLHKKCQSIKDIKPDSLWDSYLFEWQNSKKYMPIDCILELCKLINRNLEEEDILFVKYKISHNRNGIRFPFNYDEELAFLGEAIRMEGHIRKNLTQVNISNKNLIFLKKIEKIIKKYVSEKAIYKNLSVEIDIPKDKKVLEVRNNNKKLNFRVYKASRSNKLKLGFYDKSDKLTKTYIVFLSDNSKIYVKIKEAGRELISESSYKMASTVLNLTICNMTFAMLLNILLKIPKGKKSDIIFMPNSLKNSSLNVKIGAINAILDSEAWIQNNRVRVGINSRKYLEDLKELFEDFGIEPSLENKHSTLSVNSVKELQKIAKYFKFSLKRKNEQLKKASEKKLSLRWGEGTKLILNILRENGELTNKQILNYRSRHIDTIHKQLLKCIEKNLVRRDTDVWPYKYYITKKGLNNLGYGSKV